MVLSFLSSGADKSEPAEPDVAILGSWASHDFLTYFTSNDILYYSAVFLSS